MPGVRLLAFLLIIGAMMNVAVAWLCAVVVFLPPAGDERAVSIGMTHAWAITRAEKIGAMWIESARVPVELNSLTPTPQSPSDLVPRWRRRAYATPRFTHSVYWDAPFEERAIDVRGWPLRSMWCEFQEPNNLPTSPTTGGIALGHRLRGIWRYPDPIVLPLRIAPAEFALNTLFFAFVGWLVWQGMRGLVVLRGVRRGRRGLCRSCAYPVGGAAVCSECGAGA